MDLVLEGLEPCFVGFGPDPKKKRDQISCQFKKEHKALQHEAGRLQRSGIETTALLIQGFVIEVILHQSSKLGIEMIIVGSHGHGAVYNLVIGSVSEGLLKRSPCPVLVIPTQDRA
ncbi:MAG: universal stress protein [Verrucomicrobiales bacterium]